MDQMSELEPAGSIKCPKCGAQMSTADVGGVTIDRCPTCGGMWFDAMELDKVLASREVREAAKKLDSLPPAKESRERMHCPRDKGWLIRMAALGQPHVHYESCKVCGGAFLDSGELRDLSQVTLLERLKRIFGG
jgi:Zn-finger nucleic acid-binding protein